MSDNGIDFYPIKSVNESGLKGLHNSGMDGNGYGHIDITKPIILGYAYQESNGTWGAAGYSYKLSYYHRRAKQKGYLKKWPFSHII